MEMEEIKIGIVGMSGSGLSSTGNTLIGRDVFTTGDSLSPITSESQTETINYEGRGITITDSIAINETRSNRTIKEALLNILPLHIVLLVFKIDRITKFHRDMFRTLENVYGTRVYQHMIVLFTFKDKLGDVPFDSFLRQDTRDYDVKTLLTTISNRYLTLSNTVSFGDNVEQRQQILEMALHLANENQMKVLKRKTWRDTICEFCDVLLNCCCSCCTWTFFCCKVIAMLVSFPVRKLCNKNAKVVPNCPERKTK